MPNNGSKETEGKVVKMCPFLGGKWCIGDSCALWMVVFHEKVNSLGVRGVSQEGMCSIPALCQIMSSSKQAPSPPQVMKMPPNLLRG